MVQVHRDYGDGPSNLISAPEHRRDLTTVLDLYMSGGESEKIIVQAPYAYITMGKLQKKGLNVSCGS